MPVAYATNNKSSKDYIIMVYGVLPRANGFEGTIADDSPMYKDTMDSVLQSILKRLPGGPIQGDYRIVCNVETQPDLGGFVDEMNYEVPLKGSYRVWIAVHMHEGYTDERYFLCPRVIGGMKGEIIDEETNHLQNSGSCEEQFVLIRDHMKPFHHPSMKQLVRHLKHCGIHGEICRHIFAFVELEGVKCISLNGVSEKFMADAWSNIISKSSRYMNKGHGRMLHPMWKVLFQVDYPWGTLKESSFMFDGVHWRIHNATRTYDRSEYHSF